ncbi:hypothetical protein, partial [Aeromonas veronii]|uniref:hypothetical protein n=1 Tax=Aeromonas veronii TaxID=654 RepID=UPI001F44C087
SSSLEPDFHFTIPIMRLTESAEQIIGQRPGHHFTLPITPMPKEGANKSLDTKTHHSKLLILNG